MRKQINRTVPAYSVIYHARELIAEKVVAAVAKNGADASKAVIPDQAIRTAIVKAIANCYACYAGYLHLMRGRDETKPAKHVNSGYAPKFETPALFPGRTATASRWSDLRGTQRLEKPWLNGLPRMIFLSDMGDALDASIPFDYLKSEVIDVVNSPAGKRHIWLWISKRPSRMAAFSEWLLEHGAEWPENLVAMTTVTSEKTIFRVNQIKRVRCKLHGLSVEPLWSRVVLPLDGIDWVFVGGESGHHAKQFDIEWAREIISQCRPAGTAVFIKQLGSHAVDMGRRLRLSDDHGGDWNEWPQDLRIREFPPQFFCYNE